MIYCCRFQRLTQCDLYRMIEHDEGFILACMKCSIHCVGGRAYAFFGQNALKDLFIIVDSKFLHKVTHFE